MIFVGPQQISLGNRGTKKIISVIGQDFGTQTYYNLEKNQCQVTTKFTFLPVFKRCPLRPTLDAYYESTSYFISKPSWTISSSEEKYSWPIYHDQKWQHGNS